MKKPDNYESEQATNLGEGYAVIEPGGYICKITQVQVTNSKAGNEMLVILFDIAEGEYKGFYKKQFDENTNPDKKWKGVLRQVVGGSSTKFFKGMMTAIEKSNSGFVFDFDETKLKGKLFGGLFGREEYFNVTKGEYQFSTKLFWVRDTETVKGGKFEIPKDKLAERTQATTAPSGFHAVGETLDDEELPF